MIMAHLLAGDDKLRDLSCDDGHRSNLTGRQDSLGDYRFARPQAKRGSRMRSALRRVNGYLKVMIEAIADSKVRRIRRDLELRGIRFDPHGNNWVVRKSGPMERSP
jgi:hypothetical protein